MSYDLYAGLLQMFSDFDRANSLNVEFIYTHDEPKLIELNKRYELSKIAGDESDLTKTLNLLHWLSNNTFHNGNYNGLIPNNSIDLMNYTFAKGEEAGVHCFALATILTDCYLSVGLKARKVFIMPCNPYEADNHVVTIVYINELRKWIMVDPSFDGYMMDKNGTILSPWEARQVLSEQEFIQLNPEFNYNGDYSGEKYGETPKSYVEYMAKDLFYFCCTATSCSFHTNDDTAMFTVAPTGYGVKKSKISNIQYRLKKFGNNEWLQNWLVHTQKETINYITLSEFSKQPY